MADTMATLVKLAKHKVEHAQQELAAGMAELNRLLGEREDWEVRRQHAEARAKNAEDIMDVVAFERRVAREVIRLQALIDAQEKVVEGLRLKLSEDYAVREKYHLLWEAQQAALAKLHADKVQAGLDESAGVLFEMKGRR